MLYFVTENKQKFDNAQVVLEKYNLFLKQQPLPLTEIQSDSLEDIAMHKARLAYDSVRKPLVVKDDGWYITALKGFPRTYMKYVNQWFSPDDFLNLIKPYKNREMIFRDALYYIDGKTEKLFVHEIPGVIVQEPKGKAVPSAMVSSFRKDGKTMAECINEGIHFADEGNSIWDTFAKWYKKVQN